MAIEDNCSLEFELELELKDPTSVALSMVEARPVREMDWPEVVLDSCWWRVVGELDQDDGMATGADVAVVVVWVMVVVVVVLLSTRVSTAKELRLLLCCWGSGGVASDRREGTESSLRTGETGVRGTVVFFSTICSGSAVMTVATTASSTVGVEGVVETLSDSTLEWIEELVSLGRMILANRPKRSRRGDVEGGDEGEDEVDDEVAREAEGERLVNLEKVFERVGAGETGTETASGAGAATGTSSVGIASTTTAAAIGRLESSTTSSTISSTNVAGASIIWVENCTSSISCCLCSSWMTTLCSSITVVNSSTTAKSRLLISS